MENDMVLSWRVIGDIMGIVIPIKVKHIFWSYIIYKGYTSRRDIYNRMYWCWKNYIG